MIENDSVRLLREVDAGIKMGITSIEDVIESTEAPELRRVLEHSREEHVHLQNEVEKLLDRYHDDGKEPDLMAKGMSWIKTNAKLAMEESDATIADLMTDGCNMGVKSLRRYRNQYPAADATTRSIADRQIQEEEHLIKEVQAYL